MLFQSNHWQLIKNSSIFIIVSLDCNVFFQIEMKNIATGEFVLFKAGVWLSKTKDDKLSVRDFPAIIKDKVQLKSNNCYLFQLVLAFN